MVLSFNPLCSNPQWAPLSLGCLYYREQKQEEEEEEEEEEETLIFPRLPAAAFSD
jgi:hypothetical protein